VAWPRFKRTLYEQRRCDICFLCFKMADYAFLLLRSTWGLISWLISLCWICLIM